MAAATVRGEIVAGVIHDPICRDFAYAVRDGGAWIERENGMRTALASGTAGSGRRDGGHRRHDVPAAAPARHGKRQPLATGDQHMAALCGARVPARRAVTSRARSGTAIADGVGEIAGRSDRGYRRRSRRARCRRHHAEQRQAGREILGAVDRVDNEGELGDRLQQRGIAMRRADDHRIGKSRAQLGRGDRSARFVGLGDDVEGRRFPPHLRGVECAGAADFRAGGARAEINADLFDQIATCDQIFTNAPWRQHLGPPATGGCSRR